MEFSEKADPFFLSAQKAKMNNNAAFTIIHDIKPSVIHRIRASELVILEELI